MNDCYYGDTHTGKSKAGETLADELIRKYNKKVRVHMFDGGGDTWNAHGWVDEGMIEIEDFAHYHWPMTVIKLLAEYWWPDAKSGKLAAPPSNLFDSHVMMVFEGGAAIGQYLLSDIPGGLAWQSATQTKFGGVKDEDEELSTTDGIKAGGYEMQGSNSPRHSMIAQRKLLSMVRTARKFPGHKLWTSHPAVGPDKASGGEAGKFGEIKGKRVIGPDFGGPATVSLISKEFGNVLHFETVDIITRKKDETTNKTIATIDREHRIYTRRHFDPEQLVQTEYIAGNRCPIPKMMPDHFVSKEPGDSVLQFYTTLSEAVKVNNAKKAATQATGEQK